MAVQPISVDERKWQAENDVETLTEAETIKKTPARLKAAKVAAVRMIQERQQKVNDMSKVTSISSKEVKTKKPAPKEKSKSKPMSSKINPAAMVRM